MRLGLREAADDLKGLWRRTGRRYVAGAVHGAWVGLVGGYEAGVAFGPLPRRPALNLAAMLICYAGVRILGRSATGPHANGS